jgi:hypothetical protein
MLFRLSERLAFRTICALEKAITASKTRSYTMKTAKQKLITPQALIQVVPLTEAELAENADRAARNWAPYVKVVCTGCQTVSPFRTQDELAVSCWQTNFQPHETPVILCPTCNQ